MRRRLDFSQALWYNHSGQTFFEKQKGKLQKQMEGEKMGVILGVSDIVIGIGILWQMKRYDPLKKEMRRREWRKLLSFMALFFIGWGIFLILLCILTRGEENLLDILTYLAGLGLVMLYGGISNIKTLRACKMETDGIFMRFQPVLGFPAFFEYETGGRKYRGLSQSCNMEKYRNVFVEGECYRIYVNEKKPEQFVAARRIEPADILTTGLGLVCVCVWLIFIVYRIRIAFC